MSKASQFLRRLFFFSMPGRSAAVTVGEACRGIPAHRVQVSHGTTIVPFAAGEPSGFSLGNQGKRSYKNATPTRGSRNHVPFFF